jgi:hypothetical protein
MTLLHEAVNAKKLDVRVSERNITRGAMKAEDFNKAVKDLPDDGDNAEYVNVEELAEQEDIS